MKGVDFSYPKPLNSPEDIFQPSPESCENVSSNSFEQFDTGMIEQTTFYENPILSKVLNKSRFPVFLVTFPLRKEQLAIKLFPFVACNQDPCFFNEIKAAKLNHKNILAILQYDPKSFIDLNNSIITTSYTLMELAPYGDFHDILKSRKIFIDDKLARTCFHQLIEGLEYLHTVGISHLDLKPKSLLLGKNYILKITDFDQAYFSGNRKILSRGTENFRSPEIKRSVCQNPATADIYSAGIILFVLKCSGTLPSFKDRKQDEFGFLKLLLNNSSLFWKKHCEIQNRLPSFFDEDFKDLFTSMVSLVPEERPNIKQIKNSRWYKRPIYSQKEVANIIGGTFIKSEI